MARIRSVHPGLFTDEAFVSLSCMARLLVIGIWTESDDQGVFEWKPITLKMRLLPADTADVPQLLAELEAADLVRRFAVGERQYGAVRNFGRFQRPKKPNQVHPLPNEFRTYVAAAGPNSPSEPLEDGAGSPPGHDGGGEVGKQFPTGSPPVSPMSEKFPQMEDGGGREGGREEVSVASQPHPASAGAAPTAADIETAFEAWNTVAREIGNPVARKLDPARRRAIAVRLRDDGGVEAWRQALAEVRASPLCRGEGDRAWRADLDFVCQAKSFRRLIEGFYRGGPPSVSPRGNGGGLMGAVGRVFEDLIPEEVENA
jgi:hypothetical protein